MRDNIIHPCKRGCCTRAASSPSQSKPVGFASSPKVGALGSPRKLHLFAKASPFEERLPPAGGRCRAATKGGVWHGEAVTERASPLKKKHPQQLFADFLKSRSDCYRCFYFIRYYVMQKERLLVILFSVLRVIQMLAPFACQCGAQLQQCKAQDAGKNTGKSGTDPVSIGKTAD